MSFSSHQTVRLAAGRHRAPEQGICAMELSSMLAGQRFSGRPSCVCPVVAAFPRGYNDRLPDTSSSYIASSSRTISRSLRRSSSASFGARTTLRQERLLPWAAEAVGTRSVDPAEVQRRTEAVEPFAKELLPRRRRVHLELQPRRRREDRLLRCEVINQLCGIAVLEAPATAVAVDRFLAELCRTKRPDARWSAAALPLPAAPLATPRAPAPS